MSRGEKSDLSKGSWKMSVDSDGKVEDEALEREERHAALEEGAVKDTTVEFTQEQEEELRFAFYLFDENGDGDITLKELENIMRSFGMKPSEKELKEMIAKVDTDHSGTVDFSEFLEMMRSKMNDAIPEDDVAEAFKLFDRDKDGLISRDELLYALQKMSDGVTMTECDLIMDELDLDGDGKLDLNEFRLMVNTDPNQLKMRPPGAYFKNIEAGNDPKNTKASKHKKELTSIPSTSQIKGKKQAAFKTPSACSENLVNEAQTVETDPQTGSTLQLLGEQLISAINTD